MLRFSTAAPPADFLSRSMQQFKADLEKAAPEFDVQLHYASSLFRQGTEVPAMQRGNLEMSTMTTFEVAQQVPELGFFNRAATCSATTTTLQGADRRRSASATSSWWRRRWTS